MLFHKSSLVHLFLFRFCVHECENWVWVASKKIVIVVPAYRRRHESRNPQELLNARFLLFCHKLQDHNLTEDREPSGCPNKPKVDGKVRRAMWKLTYFMTQKKPLVVSNHKKKWLILCNHQRTKCALITKKAPKFDFRFLKTEHKLRTLFHHLPVANLPGKAPRCGSARLKIRGSVRTASGKHK